LNMLLHLPLSFVKPGRSCNWTPSIGFMSKGA